MYCDTLIEPLIRRIEIEKKSLDEIAAEVCGNTVKNPRNKIIRIIKLLLGNKYLIKHAQTLGYHSDKAVRQKSTTDEVVNRKIVSEEEIEDSDNSGESNSVTVSSCTTRVLDVNTEHEDEAGQSKGEQVLEVHDKPATCCHKRVVRKVRTDSENITEKESGEMKEPEKAVEEHDAPVENKFDVLVGEIKRLIEKFSLEDVKKALEVAESDL